MVAAYGLTPALRPCPGPGGPDEGGLRSALKKLEVACLVTQKVLWREFPVRGGLAATAGRALAAEPESAREQAARAPHSRLSPAHNLSKSKQFGVRRTPHPMPELRRSQLSDDSSFPLAAALYQPKGLGGKKRSERWSRLGQW